MTILDILEILKTGGIGIIIFLITLIKIPKVEVNLWGLLGRAINKEQRQQTEKLQQSVNNLTQQLNAYIADEQMYRADEARREILQFNDELLRKVRHSKEHFDNVLRAVDRYEDYCVDHPLYPNNQAMLAIRNIKAIYEICLEQHDFLQF